MSEVNEKRGSERVEPAEGRDEQALDEVDRELRAALSVSPPAGFEARILRRVEKDRPVRFSSFGAGRGVQARVLLAAAASIILVAGLIYALIRPPSDGGQPPPQMAGGPGPVSQPPVVRAPVTKEAAPGRVEAAPSRVQVTRSLRGVTRRAGPEVIVPLDRMDAVRRLVRAVNEGRIEAPPEPTDGPMGAPAEIVVRPLVVDPIPVPALEPRAATPQPNRGA